MRQVLLATDNLLRNTVGMPEPGQPTPTPVATLPVDPAAPAGRVVAGRIEWRGTFAALRHRNYRLFFCGQLISLIGTWVQQVAHGWLIYDHLAGTPFSLGLIAFLGFLPVTVLTVPAGALADRLDKRRILLWAQAGAMILAFALAALVFTDTVRLWHVAVLSLLLGLVNAFEIPTRQSLVVDLVDRRDLTNAIALNSSVFNTARLIGPALAGFLISWIGLAGCFALNALSFGAVILAYWRMQLSLRQITDRPNPLWQSMREALDFVRQNPSVRRIVVTIAVFSLTVLPMNMLLPVFARDCLGGDERTFGFLGAANGFGALLGGLTLASWQNRPRKSQLIYFGLLGLCGTAALFATSSTVWLSMGLLAVAGWCFIIAAASANSAVQEQVPDALRGRVMGIYVLAFLGLVPFGSLLLGTVARWSTAPLALLLSCGVCAVTVILVGQEQTAKP